MSDGQLFLVDGYALIYRAFFAMIGRPLTTSRGENTSAVFGVAQFLLRLFERYRPAYVGWVHDAGTSFRHETYPAYKATREKLDAELQHDFDRSVERVEDLLAAFHVPVIAQEGYEADDVIATLASEAARRGLPAVIVSGDKDLYQLVGPGISLLNPGRGGRAAVEEQWVDPSNAAERLGVPPERVVDYLALVGDTSDNIPGVKGIGDKTARQLIEQYGDLESILAHAGDLTGKRAREALLAAGDSARLSRELVTVRRDVPVTLDLDALRVTPPDAPRLRRLLTELEFHELLQRLDLPGAAVAEVAHRLVTDVGQLPDLVAAWRSAEVVAVRTLFRGADPLSGELVGLALAGREGEAWYLPLRHGGVADLVSPQPARDLPPLADPAMAPVRELLTDPKVPKAGHQIKSDWLALRRAGVELGGIPFDVMLASFVLDPGRRSHGLEALAAEHLHLKLRDGGGGPGRGKRELPPWELAAADAAREWGAAADAILRLRRHFRPPLTQLALEPLLQEIELPLVPVLVDLEWRGIAVDVERLRELSRQFGQELERLERAILAEAGTDFNLNSTPQLRHVLFEKLQLPILKKTKTGPSTDEDVLVELAGMELSPVPKLLLEYRKLSKLKSTYADVLPARVRPASGRIHTSFDQAGAATGRLSSFEPNLQNIPVRTPHGELIRRCFVPGPGCQLIVADYSQIELRLLAHLSEDPAFIEAFRRGGDIHRETAAIIFGVTVDGVTAEMRSRAKTINFATIYGQGPFALSRQLGISQDEAKDFIRLYFERFAGVRRFLDQTIERARRVGFVETLFGRRRYIPELKDPNYNVRAFGERTAMNSPLQGSAADLIKIAMIRLHRALVATGSQGAMLLQVHDELVLEAPAAEVDAVARVVRREMEGAAELSVPLVVDIGVGENWLDAKR
ncbi:MAG TPA: DNA polymerase I [Gemmatimonadales bacterium]|nr:DNA polymerase I [Gemmatimonadales bacterium]